MKILILMILLFPTMAIAESIGDVMITGKVIDKESGEPLIGANVQLLGSNRGATTNADGFFNISAPSGSYKMRISYVGYKTEIIEVSIQDSPIELSISLKVSPIEGEAVVVTAHAAYKNAFESYNAATVIEEKEVTSRLSTSIGQMLDGEPGIGARSNGSNATRPVIHGFSDEKVLVLVNGVRTGDLSSTAPDHAMNVNPASVDKLEVIKGPQSLLYGSSAIGGVVNIMTASIPTQFESGVHFKGVTSAASVNNAFTSNGALSYGNGPWAFTGDLGINRTGNLQVPSFDQKDGTGNIINNNVQHLDNTRNKIYNGSIGSAYHFDRGYVGGSFEKYYNLYGLPVVEEAIRLKINSKKYNFAAQYKPSGFIESVSLNGGYENYNHKELEETGEVGTEFFNKSFSSNLIFSHKATYNFSGTFGLSYLHKNYKTIGEEAIAPPSITNNFGIFGVEEYVVWPDKLRLQAGLRYDFYKLKRNGDFSDNTLESIYPNKKNLSTISSSGGFLYSFNKNFVWAANVSRSYRAPTTEELFSYNFHAGTASFDSGNGNLKSEIGIGYETTLRYHSDDVQVEGTYYFNTFDNYIFFRRDLNYTKTDADNNTFPVRAFLQGPAQVWGIEGSITGAVNRYMSLGLSADYTRGERTGDNEPLPQIPPLRVTFRSENRYKRFHIGFDVRKVFDQKKVDRTFESPTNGYTLLNVHIGTEFYIQKYVNTVTLRIDNLTNKLYYDHLSVIKDYAPMPGRNIMLIYQLLF
ncbi:TonB-dependent receptor [bacterium]|nr:MAG: TonB-dependent receptor [bacterium]